MSLRNAGAQESFQSLKQIILKNWPVKLDFFGEEFSLTNDSSSWHTKLQDFRQHAKMALLIHHAFLG